MNIMASRHITSWQIDRWKLETVTDFIFLGSKITADGDLSHKIKRCLLFGRKAVTNFNSILQNIDIILPTKVCTVSSSHVQMWELAHKEGWAPKNWCFSNVVLEKTLERPLDSKDTKPINPEGNQLWIFILRTDAEANWSSILVHQMRRADSLERLWCWERLRAGEEAGNREWDVWMASLTQWMWVWANSGRECMTGKPGMLHTWDYKELDMTWQLNNIN